MVSGGDCELSAFNVVPVLDLMRGQVVHARRGQRRQYRPIESRLAPSSRPADIVAALLDLAPFPIFYVADLDALQSSAPHGDHHDARDHRELIAWLADRHPEVQWWVDAGLMPDRAWHATSGADLWPSNLRPVIGTESGDVPARLARYGDAAVLSLDSRNGRALGVDPFASQERRTARAANAETTENAIAPTDVIVMTLDRVGSEEGPDLGALAGVSRQIRSRRIRTNTAERASNLWAAGGVRNAADLSRLRDASTPEAPMAGALVASALHSGSLNARELASLMTGDA